ncbi:facilitated trehalose transporter Tret1-like isoform X2 [Nasonia vitripennis]|uniref:Major facilitator superfamily (MFS) profile domain-containing protein n=1 Tax=Nasonia vitripennis TaxID=7425 RepID=A0A7M7J0W0_NASVI|nr:facilitated trehalose transporter Tret1-like isoform X2 [Nasonia vitripennis]
MRNKLGSLKVSDTKIISNFRRLTSQCCATGALGLLLLITGGNFGLPTILIPALYNSTEMNVTMTDVSWIGSINCISIPIGSAPSGIYIDYFGRRLGVIIMTIPMFLGWLILHFADDIFDVLVALTLIGIACGIVEGPIFMYIAEISETRFRSALLSTANTAAIVGKAKFEEAKDALSWLRGWATHSNVMEEFCMLGEAFQSTSNSKTDFKLRSIFLIHNIRNSVKPFLQKSFCMPFMLTTFLFFIHAFNGTSILVYSVVIFKNINTPIDSYAASVIMGLFNVIGTVLSIIVIPWIGKRKVCFMTTIIPSISLLLASIYILLYNEGHVADKNLTWIPVNMLFLTILFIAGFNTVPWIFIGEVFPATLRSTGSGIVIALFYTFSWAINIEYLYMVKEINFFGSFLFFSVINFIGCIVLFILLPETEGKSLEKIQSYFSDNTNIKQSQNNEICGHVDDVDFM